MATNATTQADFQVLEFDLDGERFCVEIGTIDEIVERPTEITNLPNSPAHVEGVVDLRGRTTTIVNPKPKLELPNEDPGTRVIVFESDDDGVTVGWLVDSVLQVIGIREDDVDRTVRSESVVGLVKRESDEKLTVWVDVEVFDREAC